MNDLAFSLRTMCTHNVDGSHMTRAQRARGLNMIAGELQTLGFRLPIAQSLKPKHVQRLVEHWREEKLSNATIKNRLGWVRWWAMKVNKPGLVPRDNAALGIGDRITFKGIRAAATETGAMAALPERMQLALRLQMAFGLRFEESLKLRVAVADHGDQLALQASWTKGGRARLVPIVHDRQRGLLEELRGVCGDGSLIPTGTTYIAFRRQMERAILKAGITNVHKHRHWYACWRYRTLAGVRAPAEGGPLHDDLDTADRARLDAIRLEISGELGHSRLDVTDAYLGGRWRPKGAR